jgi:DNA-binding CsgD family transcriptional regulator
MMGQWDRTVSDTDPVGADAGVGRVDTKEELVNKLAQLSVSSDIATGLRYLTQHVGASCFLLARYDLVQEQGLDFIVSSDWPFDLVRRLATELAGVYARSTELDKCLSLFQPAFALLPEDAVIGTGLSREFCSMTLNVGRTRLSLMLLYRDGMILSPERLRNIGLLTGYFFSVTDNVNIRQERDFELTEREIECLFWISEGKTSDEIAVILGISRNTINNYITSVMRKTATKTRSEAIAYAVRNNLV